MKVTIDLPMDGNDLLVLLAALPDRGWTIDTKYSNELVIYDEDGDAS